MPAPTQIQGVYRSSAWGCLFCRATSTWSLAIWLFLPFTSRPSEEAADKPLKKKKKKSRPPTPHSKTSENMPPSNHKQGPIVTALATRAVDPEGGASTGQPQVVTQCLCILLKCVVHTLLLNNTGKFCSETLLLPLKLLSFILESFLSEHDAI